MDANDSDQAAVSVVPVVGLEDEKLRFLEWIEKGRGGHGSIAAAELNRDRPIGTKYIEPALVLPKSINRSRVLAHFRASSMVNRIAMRNMANPCDWGVLTWFEATTFVQAAAAKLDTNKAAALGLLMLLAGRFPMQRNVLTPFCFVRIEWACSFSWFCLPRSVRVKRHNC